MEVNSTSHSSAALRSSCRPEARSVACTPTGGAPASPASSTAASETPARRRTPPSLDLMTATAPGLRKSPARAASGSHSARIVRAMLVLFAALASAPRAETESAGTARLLLSSVILSREP